MTGTMRMLVVCTANICRSPAAAALLSHELVRRFGDHVAVASAGTAAEAGATACELTAALVATYPQRAISAGPRLGADILDYSSHRSQLLTTDAALGSDLVLALDRTHRARLAQLAPAARSRTFTLRQAAALAVAVAGPVAAGGLPPGAPPLPGQPVDRLRWFIAELDAARGLPAPASGHAGEQESAGATDLHWHPDDVPDPHVVGYQVHPMAVELIERAVSEITASLDGILAVPITAAAPPSA